MERMVPTDRRQAANSASLHGHLTQRICATISFSEPLRPFHAANLCGHLIERTGAASTCTAVLCHGARGESRPVLFKAQAAAGLEEI